MCVNNDLRDEVEKLKSDSIALKEINEMIAKFNGVKKAKKWEFDLDFNKYFLTVLLIFW